MKSLSLVKKLSAANPALQAHIVRNRKCISLKFLFCLRNFCGRAFDNCICLFTVAGWNKDYKPGPYPKTEKEREAAAKKYYLLPEEYKPYADNGLGYGDYPKVGGGLGVEFKDNYYPYDYPEIKRNFNEPVSLISSS